ncbi:hypothetical protein [Shewanella sp.]|uniref:hypothetical protein n=1 Tax=Shewanella sp. TaxID=50422 RepID=UPI0040539AFC
MEPTLKNWYEQSISPTFELIRSYIEGVEEQADLSVLHYKENKKMHVIEGYPDTRVITEYKGLDDDSWNIHEIFCEYFPNLQRKSALLTLTGIFEHELDNLCDSYGRKYDTKVRLNHIAGKGLERSTRYLEKVCGYDVYKTSRERVNVDAIQKLRNAIVHQNGKISDASVLSYIKSVDLLVINESEVIIGKGYLAYVLNNYDGYIQLLDKSIKLSCQK